MPLAKPCQYSEKAEIVGMDAWGHRSVGAEEIQLCAEIINPDVGAHRAHPICGVHATALFGHSADQAGWF